jgi:F0F1-type ATP synthase assembly protein I
VKSFTGARHVTEPPRKDDPFSAIRSAGLLLAIPTLLIVSPLVGFFLGSALDGRLKTSPWFTILGLILGFVAAARETYRIYRRYQAEEEREKRRR